MNISHVIIYRPFLFLLVLIGSGALFAQETKRDSVNALLNNIVNDSLKTAKLDELLLHYQDRDTILHLYYIEQRFSKALEEKKGNDYGDALLELSIYKRNTNDIDSSYYYVNKALDIFLKVKNEERIYYSKNALAQVLQDKRAFVDAINNYKEVITYYEKRGSKEDIDQALTTKMNLGTLYMDIVDWDNAEKIFKELYNHPQVKEDKELLSSVCINLIVIKRRQFDFDNALKYGDEALAIETRPKSLANLYSNLANTYGNLKNYVKADEYYKKSLEINKELGRVKSISSSYHNIGYNLMRLGKFDEAEEYFLKSNKLFKESGNLAYLQKSFQALAEVNYAKENFKESLHYFVDEGEIGDSIFNINKQKAISEIEVKYETEKVKREKDAAQQQAIISDLESKKNKNLFLGALLIIGLVGVASLFFFGRLKARKKTELITLELHEAQKRLAIEKQYRDSELKALKAQMNPHFIFNALNSIQEYIILNKKNLAGDYLGKFADLMRKYLHHSDAGTLSVQDEVDSLEMYLELEALRFEDTFSYAFNVSEEINKEQVLIPTMLIQPYVENALKHGLLHRKNNRKLAISFSKETDASISCVIEDNGVGRKRAASIKAQRNQSHVSFATKATENRLDLLNYQKDRKIGVETTDLFSEDGTATGTRVVLLIPTIIK